MPELTADRVIQVSVPFVRQVLTVFDGQFSIENGREIHLVDPARVIMGIYETGSQTISGDVQLRGVIKIYDGEERQVTDKDLRRYIKGLGTKDYITIYVNEREKVWWTDARTIGDETVKLEGEYDPDRSVKPPTMDTPNMITFDPKITFEKSVVGGQSISESCHMVMNDRGLLVTWVSVDENDEIRDALSLPIRRDIAKEFKFIAIPNPYVWNMYSVEYVRLLFAHANTKEITLRFGKRNAYPLRADFVNRRFGPVTVLMAPRIPRVVGYGETPPKYIFGLMEEFGLMTHEEVLKYLTPEEEAEVKDELEEAGVAPEEEETEGTKEKPPVEEETMIKFDTEAFLPIDGKFHPVVAFVNRATAQIRPFYMRLMRWSDIPSQPKHGLRTMLRELYHVDRVPPDAIFVQVATSRVALILVLETPIHSPTQVPEEDWRVAP